MAGMEENPSLFDTSSARAHARGSDPQTAHKAARRITKDGTVKSQRDKILAAIDTHGELSAHQLSVLLGIPRDSITPRIGAMKREGILRATGRKVPGPSGDDNDTYERGDGVPLPPKVTLADIRKRARAIIKGEHRIEEYPSGKFVASWGELHAFVVDVAGADR
jgi:hypothetical protein